MRRRQFIGLLLGSATAGISLSWPLAADAQQGIPPTGGYFSDRSSDAEEQYRTTFRQGLDAAGYADGRNVRIEYRYSNGQDDRLPALAAELVRQQVSVLVATDRPSALAAKHATKIIPIVFSTGGDPVKLGLVEALTVPR